MSGPAPAPAADGEKKGFVAQAKSWGGLLAVVIVGIIVWSAHKADQKWEEAHRPLPSLALPPANQLFSVGVHGALTQIPETAEKRMLLPGDIIPGSDFQTLHIREGDPVRVFRLGMKRDDRTKDEVGEVQALALETLEYHLSEVSVDASGRRVNYGFDYRYADGLWVTVGAEDHFGARPGRQVILIRAHIKGQVFQVAPR